MPTVADRFPAPWSVRRTDEGFAIDSAEGTTLALVAFGMRAEGLNRAPLGEDEAARMASAIAHLPVLLKRPQY